MGHHTYKQTLACDTVPCRVDVFLAGQVSLSRTNIQKCIADGFVLVNQRVVSASYLVQPNDVIAAQLPLAHTATTLVPAPIPLSIVYEDTSLLVLYKPASMVVHPDHVHRSGTLAHALAYWYVNLPLKDGCATRPGLVHRLDKGTSGLLLVAKTPESMACLEQQFYHHTIQRTYYALVWGTPALDEGTIDLPLSKTTAYRQGLHVFPDPAEGKRAVTHYQVLNRLHRVSLIACRLETGRTHQIRVHMQHLGHPLFGDPLYGGRTIASGQSFAAYKAFVQNCFKIMPYQALHAATLGFQHPITRRFCTFTAPFPANFAQLLEKWKRYMGLPQDCFKQMEDFMPMS